MANEAEENNGFPARAGGTLSEPPAASVTGRLQDPREGTVPTSSAVGAQPPAAAAGAAALSPARRAGPGVTATGKRTSEQNGAAEPPKKRAKAKENGKKGARHDSSLCVLTEKFTEIIHQSPTGIVDLHEAALALGVRKRRIYDITNVLEGIGLIRKESKNNMQWTGDFQAQREITALRQSVRELQAEERQLDLEMDRQMRALRMLSEDPEQTQHAYISVDDIRALEKMQGESLIVIKAPGGTTLKVPDPFLAGEDGQSRYQIMLKSSGGPIDVWLLDSAETPPEAPQDVYSEYSLASGVVGDDSLLVAPGALSDPSDIYHLFPPDAGVSDYYADDAFAAAT